MENKRGAKYIHIHIERIQHGDISAQDGNRAALIRRSKNFLSMDKTENLSVYELWVTESMSVHE